MASRAVLRARLVPPRLPARCVSRGALVERVRAGLRGRLVAFIAGPGYGKSTLLALSLSGLNSAWCSLDERMGDPAILMVHLVSAVALCLPGFGAGLRLTGSVAELVAEFCGEAEAIIAEDLVLALDDVHTVEGAGSAEALALLTRDLPPAVHLALAGRGRLPFPLARLRLGEDVMELGEPDLRFDAAESAELVRAEGLEITPEAAVELHRLTEGWPAGLVLAARAQGRLPAERMPLPAGELFDYLAEEVLAGQPAELQDFLVATAILERFTPELAARVSGRVDARQLLDALVARHLFTVRLEGDGEWHRYHNLLRAFLRRRLLATAPERIPELHRRAAEAWMSAGAPHQAIAHHLAAGDQTTALDLLEPIAEEMATGSDAAILARWLFDVPQERWGARPALALANAAVLCGQGQLDRATVSAEQAVARLRSAGERERAASACFYLMQALAWSGGERVEQAIETGRRFLAELAPGDTSAAGVQVMLASLYGYVGRYPEARDALAHARTDRPPAPGLKVEAAIVQAAWIDFPEGHIAAALDGLSAAIAKLERDGRKDPLALLPSAHSCRGWILNQLGRYDDALEEARAIARSAERRGQLEALGVSAAWTRLEALAGLGRWRELEIEIRESGTLFRDGAGAVRRYYLDAASAQLAAHQGDRERVQAEIAAARAVVGEEPANWGRALVLCRLANAARAVGLAVLARELAAEALRRADRARAPWAQARAALLGAACRDDDPAADALIERALTLSVEYALEELWIRKERAHAGELLERALVHGLGPPGAAVRIAAACEGEVFAACLERVRVLPPAVRLGLAEHAGGAREVDAQALARLLRDPDPAVRAAARRTQGLLAGRTRQPLQFVTLGGFGVHRAGIPLPEAAFGRRKARGLLAALIAAGGPVHRDQLIEWFWPDLRLDRALSALHTTLHALRRALEPGLERGRAASLVVAEVETYRLSPGPADRVDVDEFLRLAGAARGGEPLPEAIARLEAAEAAYGGPFLPDEWRYEEWAQPRRQEVEETYLGLLARLARALLDADRPVAAIPRLKCLLRLEPEREGWHRDLMSAYAAVGEPALALRQYQACRAKLRRLLGSEPGPETRALYVDLLRGG